MLHGGYLHQSVPHVETTWATPADLGIPPGYPNPPIPSINEPVPFFLFEFSGRGLFAFRFILGGTWPQVCFLSLYVSMMLLGCKRVPVSAMVWMSKGYR